MIRRSAFIAAVALLLSLMVHSLGVLFVSRGAPEEQVSQPETDVIAVGNAFEDIAETVSEPPPPEEAPAPEPPVETPAEPEQAEIPTSDALVASESPQDTLSPGMGPSQTVQPVTDESSNSELGVVNETNIAEPSDGENGESDERSGASPVTPEPTQQAPEGNPDTTTPPVETIVAETGSEVSEPAAPQPETSEQVAALPVPQSPVLPVTPTPEPSVIPVVPSESETTDPTPPEETVATEPEEATAPEDSEGSELAVALSLRPRLPTQRPEAEPQGVRDGSDQNSDPNAKPTQVIESPLTVYQRDGIDLTFSRRGRAVSGGIGSLGSTGPGNSDVTNYIGRVLVHLNNAPGVRVSARGSARVFFVINPDGSLARVDIFDSSGSPEIERAAKAQVQKAAPFPRPPDGKRRNVSFVYRID
ncbi:TonB family protein [Primorskyibacter sp. S87]|uniref:TonB family protein n=1 Tax=Primorskyibacter sp. S87 TaxID=3415126 RepID=UPI003C7EB14C